MAAGVVWVTKNRRPKYHPTPLSGGDRKALAKMSKARAMPLPDDALKIVMRGTDKALAPKKKRLQRPE
jgi:hypothetical protein